MVQSKMTFCIVSFAAALIVCSILNTIKEFTVDVEPELLVKNNGTYLLIGKGSNCVQFNGSEFSYAELSKLRKITLVECVELEAENFLKFLEKHFQTIESIYLFNVTIKGNFERRVYLPNLKSLYFRMTRYDMVWRSPPTTELMESFLFFKTTNDEIHSCELKDIWKLGVHVTVIIDSQTVFEINQDLGIFKSDLGLGEATDSILRNIDSNLTDLELRFTTLSEATYRELNKGSLEKVVLHNTDGPQDFNEFTNLRIFGCGSSGGHICSLPFQKSLNHLALTSIHLSNHRIPLTPFDLDILQLRCHRPLDCADSELLYLYYQARSVEVRSEIPSIELLQNILYMDKTTWIHYRFLRYKRPGDKEKFQNFLNSFCECSSVLNTKSFILKKNSDSQWIGESLDNHVQINPITGQLSKLTDIDMWGLFTKPSEEPNITNNFISSPDELLIVGDVHFLNGTTEEVLEKSNWIRNITLLEDVLIDAERFLSLLENNQDSLESICLKYVKVIGSFNRKVYLPNLKHFTMFIVDKDDVIPADHILESYFFFTAKRGMLNWKLKDIWLQGVDVRLSKTEAYDFGHSYPTELVLDHFTGLIKSNVQSSETIVNNAILSGGNLSTITLFEVHVSRPPPVYATAFVSTFILNEVIFENGIDEYIKGFENLSVLRLSRKYYDDFDFKYSDVVQNISSLPTTLARLTLENIYFNIENPSIIDLEELGMSYLSHSPIIIQFVTKTIHKYFNAKRTFLKTEDPEPELLKNAMKIKNATWIFYVTASGAYSSYSEGMKWREFITGFGLETTNKLILQRKPNSDDWIGQMVDKEAGMYKCESLDIPLMYLFHSNSYAEGCETYQQYL